MIDKHFIFLAGHHRSGTSLLHEIIREHPNVSGFFKTGVPEDEGQHLQSVYKQAIKFGGPGKYIFNKKSYMDENHELATEQSANELMNQWQKHYDESCEYYIEKSPPNLIRTRFFQKLFPKSKFIVILRHPLAVGYATQKWSKTTIKSLLEHSLRGYEIFKNDLPHLNSAYVLRYEDFVLNPQEEMEKIYAFIGIDSQSIQHEIRTNINEKYFAMWDQNRNSFWKRLLFSVTPELEERANQFGYSINEPQKLLDTSIFGEHSK